MGDEPSAAGRRAQPEHPVVVVRWAEGPVPGQRSRPRAVRAGIHDKQRMSAPDESVAPGQALTPGQVAVLQQNVASAIAARIEPGGRYCRPDEHWFQSLLRRDPSFVGVESPALREVPAWRPAGAAGSFGRGFIDLL